MSVSSKLFEQGEALQVGPYRIPRFGSLTFGEVLAFEGKDLTNPEAALMMLRRADPAFTEADLQQLPLAVFEQVLEFFKGEMRRWKDPEPEDTEPKKS